MSASDWQLLANGLSTDDARTGATSGVAAPNGGGSHVLGMRSISDTIGVVGYFAKQTGFSPIAGKGGRITGAVRRANFGAGTGFSPFLFFSAQSAAVAGAGYILGLADEAAAHIQLRKGTLSDGLASVSIVDPDTAPNVLMRSADTFAAEVWQHLRLDVIVQGTGDVILQVFRSDLSQHPVTSPVWVPIAGMEGPFSAFSGFVDDALGVNTGSQPLIGGYPGFATRFTSDGRAAYFDQVSIDRQL